jgi:hypothetical protein
MAQKKSRQTFEKLKREQAVRERRERKQERRTAARLARIAEQEPSAPADPTATDLAAAEPAAAEEGADPAERRSELDPE